MQMLLTFSQEFPQTKNYGQESTRQMLDICVDYNPEDETFNVVFVHLYENGRFLTDITILLEKSIGNPLNAILEATNLQELYFDKVTDAEKESIVPEPEFS